MKKFLALLGILFVIFCSFIVFDIYLKSKIPILEVDEYVVSVDELYIYGTHLNMAGSLNFNNDAELVLYNGDFISYDINQFGDDNGFRFNLSDLINNGIYLDEIPIGNYFMFIRVMDTVIQKENDEEIKWRYYSLKNNTEYQDTTYYTMSNYDKQIVIKNERSYPTMMICVTNNGNKNVYDIVIDPGHGGMDGGASKNGYKETDFTLDIATKLKERLEEYGLTVKLTHEIGQLTLSEKLEEYGVHGRAVIPREVNAKYLFSIHLNSSNRTNISGLEVYTAKNINYDFAKLLVNNITTNTGLEYSNYKINKVFDGIYSRNFTDEEIIKSKDSYTLENLNPYDITVNSNYYYIIRETGGIVTGAYVDNRNSIIIGNPYLNSNIIWI